MNQHWKEIWNKKGKDCKLPGENADEFAVYRELKRLDGFDVNVGNPEAYYRGFYDSATSLWEYMKDTKGIRSAFEVGCGSGANLFLLKNRGVQTGGIDYSESLVEVAEKILNDADIMVGEAINMTTEKKYDMVFSDSVFAYFPDEWYGSKVLELMFEKAQKAVVLLEIFDKEVQAECEKYRKEMMKDYEKGYKGLDKVFYPKDMFIQFAKEHHCRIEFGSVENEYYWNSRFLFNCYLYK